MLEFQKVLQRVIQLAEEREKAYMRYCTLLYGQYNNTSSIALDKVMEKEFSCPTEIESCREVWLTKEIKLRRFLYGLPERTVQMIVTVAYFGRDRDPSILNWLRGSRHWERKEIEIDQIVSKLRLGKYLRDGLELLQNPKFKGMFLKNAGIYNNEQQIGQKGE
ncbi:hypothetical protein Calhy_0415 [Caldicellulosiruptor hydrothermalis 108]|uniref:Uncharacterized protein n=1 Tax=Caldicellulosiruptor hydrothermalis (strain DSM 18901 / VKM B-2411 / 108) TaxID=632292 RepID=E4QBY9_CALH1|nr:DUF3775 domain-containing protein [Caldicellulosiruptor hydrothermalis]ADQ06163.1 hypothetical protein Calhy_0415 [Caldicellulosiruptor hydrothermalis 108]